MARKTKGQLPSGNIRIKIYDYKDADGKKHYKSFTAPTRKEAEALANEWKASKNQKDSIGASVFEEIERYITLKTAVLKPSTVRNYISIANQIKREEIADIPVKLITAADVQHYVSDKCLDSTPKTAKNHVGLIIPSIQLTRPEFAPRMTYKQPEDVDLYCPSKDEVQKLLDHCKTTEEKLGILFGALCFMRRSEACAVTFDDIDYKHMEITINKGMTMNSDNAWVITPPKTKESNRKVAVNDTVLSLIKATGRTKGYVLDTNPQTLYRAFKRVLRASGVHDFRYHDLRHHAASYAHSIGIPDRYIEKMGGWKPNSTVLKRIYQNVIDDEFEKNQKKFLKKQNFKV